MKSLIICSSLTVGFIALSSCESHEWDKTKKLYQSHESHEHSEEKGHHSDAKGEAKGHDANDDHTGAQKH